MDPSFLSLHHPVFSTIADIHPYWVYLGIFIAMVLEGGEAVLFSAIFLMHRGIVDPWIAIPVLYIGIVVSDVGWYLAGPHITKWPVIRHISQLSSVFDPFIAKHPLRALSISKFAYGLHHPMIVRFALSKHPRQKFVTYTLALSLLWVVLLSSIGYAVFASIDYVGHFVRFAEIGISLAIVGFFLVERSVAAYLESLVGPKDVKDAARDDGTTPVV